MNVAVENQEVLLYDPGRCTGCLNCEIACAFYHFKEIELEKAHLHILFSESDGKLEAVYCQHCDDPVCAASCPNEAISKDEVQGWVKINPSRCIGCRNCTFACPLSAPRFDEDFHISMKCDFCNGDPQCVRVCSPQAIRVATRKEAWQFNKKIYAEVSE